MLPGFKDHTYGARPPVAVKLTGVIAAYCITGFNGGGGSIVMPAQLTLIVSERSLKQAFLSAARMVNVELPTTVGMPLICTLLEVTLVSDNPGGKAPRMTDQV